MFRGTCTAFYRFWQSSYAKFLQSTFVCRRVMCVLGHVGILVYMALVDLVAVDFVEVKRTLRTKFVGYIALLLGASCMGILAIWA